MKKHRAKLILLAILLALVAIYFFVPSVNQGINQAIKILTSQGVEGTIDYIRSYGGYAVAISFFLMILQSIISPIPAFLITLANAAIFGPVGGAILSWTSSMAGAALCFVISRVLGRDVVERITGKGMVQQLDDFFKRFGKHAILVARLLPFMSFDLVSYAAGLTSMGFLGFIIATGLGQLPATVVYSFVGGSLTGGAQMMMIGLLVLFAITVIIYVGRKMYNERQNKKAS